MSEKYITPAFTGMVEMYTGNFSDLVGTFWHPFDGRTITDINGLSIATFNPNGRYLCFGNSVGPVTQYIPAPNNTLTLGGGAHNHSESLAAQCNWSAKSHSHTVSVSANNLGGGANNSNTPTRNSNTSSGGGTRGSTSTNKVYGVGTANGGAHNHNTSVTCNAENGGLHNHTPSVNISDGFISDSNVLRMPDYSVKLIIYVEGVKYNV